MKEKEEFKAVCGYCRRHSLFQWASVIACNANDEDEEYWGYCCANCGEFEGQINWYVIDGAA